MYVLYTTQSRLRISVPFYLIFLGHTAQTPPRVSVSLCLIFNNMFLTKKANMK